MMSTDLRIAIVAICGVVAFSTIIWVIRRGAKSRTASGADGLKFRSKQDRASRKSKEVAREVDRVTPAPRPIVAAKSDQVVTPSGPTPATTPDSPPASGTQHRTWLRTGSEAVAPKDTPDLGPPDGPLLSPATVLSSQNSFSESPSESSTSIPSIPVVVAAPPENSGGFWSEDASNPDIEVVSIAELTDTSPPPAPLTLNDEPLPTSPHTIDLSFPQPPQPPILPTVEVTVAPDPLERDSVRISPTWPTPNALPLDLEGPVSAIEPATTPIDASASASGSFESSVSATDLSVLEPLAESTNKSSGELSGSAQELEHLKLQEEIEVREDVIRILVRIDQDEILKITTTGKKNGRKEWVDLADPNGKKKTKGKKKGKKH